MNREGEPTSLLNREWGEVTAKWNSIWLFNLFLEHKVVRGNGCIEQGVGKIINAWNWEQEELSSTLNREWGELMYSTKGTPK